MSVVISVMAIIAVELFFAGLRRIRTPGYEAQIAQYGSLAHTGPRSRYARWVRRHCGHHGSSTREGRAPAMRAGCARMRCVSPAM